MGSTWQPLSMNFIIVHFGIFWTIKIPPFLNFTLFATIGRPQLNECTRPKSKDLYFYHIPQQLLKWPTYSIIGYPTRKRHPLSLKFSSVVSPFSLPQITIMLWNSSPSKPKASKTESLSLGCIIKLLALLFFESPIPPLLQKWLGVFYQNILRTD